MISPIGPKLHYFSNDIHSKQRGVFGNIMESWEQGNLKNSSVFESFVFPCFYTVATGNWAYTLCLCREEILSNVILMKLAKAPVE